MSVEYKPLDLTKFYNDLDGALQRSVEKFYGQEIEPIVLKDSGTLRRSMKLSKHRLKTVIYSDPAICSYGYKAHYLPSNYNWTTKGTMSRFLEYPLKTKGNRIFEMVGQVMRVYGYR